MSTTFWSNTIVGVRAEDIYSHETKVEKKKQFNPDTGEPYFVDVKKLYAKFGNKELPPQEYKKEGIWSSNEKVNQDWTFLEEVGLRLFCPGHYHEYVRKYGIFGIYLCSGDYNKSGSCSLEDLKNSYDKAVELFASFGYNGPVEIFSQVSGG